MQNDMTHAIHITVVNKINNIGILYLILYLRGYRIKK